MNEEQKNIETCLAEDILAEVAGVPTDAHFRSLLEEAFDPLQQSALAQAGYDDYKEVVQSHQPYTFTSSVRQMKSNLILLLRRLWRFPFGRGTIPSLADAGSLRSLADMWSHYIDRLQGNATYGIPSRLDQLTDLPSAPLLLSDRKISGADVPDGMSVAQLCCAGSIVDAVTEIIDNTTGWIMTRALFFKNAKKVRLGCSQMQFYFTGYGTNAGPIFNAFNEMEELDTFDMTEIRDTYGGGQQMTIASNCPKLKKWNAPKFGKWNFSYVVHNCPNLETVIWGTPQNDFNSAYSTYENNFTGSTSNLIHFEICADGGQLSISLHLNWWNPTNVLADADKTATFLSNFRDYIALRLTDNGAGKTLTLSQAVFSAVIDEDGDPVLDPIRRDIKDIILVKGWKVQDTNNNKFPT